MVGRLHELARGTANGVGLTLGVGRSHKVGGGRAAEVSGAEG